MKKLLSLPLTPILLAGVAAGLLTGCSSSFAPNPIESDQTPIGNIQGRVHGGQYPISGAHIYLYAAGTTGYGTAATSLICNTGSTCGSNAYQDGSGNYYVTTDSGGNFALGGEYTCTVGTQVYMVATGGDQQLSSVPAYNTAIVQMAALGQCPTAGNLAQQVPFLTINEVTTVAFAYAMSGFATTPYNVSSNAANSTASKIAIANAMANAGNIVNLQWGQAPDKANGNSNSTNPQTKIYALANILSTCVNTTGNTSAGCQALFTAAKDSSGNASTDEASAIFNIAHNQGQNVAAIWKLNPKNPVFSPTLSGTTGPNDWTLPVVYTGVCSAFGTNGSNQVTSGAYNIAFDVNGTAWIGDRQKGVIEMTPLGAVSHTYNPSFSMVKGIAISPDSTQIWVADYSGGTNKTGQVDIMSTAGAITTSMTTDIDGPSSIALDPKGYAFVANETNGSVVAFSSAGGFIDYSGAVGVTTPAWISVDVTGNVWLPSTSGNTTQVVAQVPLNYAGNSGKFKGFGTAATIAADWSYGVAIDSNDYAWFATNDLSILGSTPSNENLEDIVLTPSTNKKGKTTYSYQISSTESGSGTNGGGLGIPYKISIDGGNNIWMANEYYSTVSGYSETLSSWLIKGTAFSNGTTVGTLSATPDNSGNLWTANTDGSVTQLIGLSTPTSNPIYPGVFGTMP
ncbi:MAG TPA: hypothetical protein VHS97_05420 [Isosphaeraceae bacterium]|nr:hypothetical protein [Isosphaeraceae bacterium]